MNQSAVKVATGWQPETLPVLALGRANPLPIAQPRRSVGLSVG
jgi:hypothetical protein